MTHICFHFIRFSFLSCILLLPLRSIETTIYRRSARPFSSHTSYTNRKNDSIPSLFLSFSIKIRIWQMCLMFSIYQYIIHFILFYLRSLSLNRLVYMSWFPFWDNFKLITGNFTLKNYYFIWNILLLSLYSSLPFLPSQFIFSNSFLFFSISLIHFITFECMINSYEWVYSVLSRSFLDSLRSR